MSHTMKRWFSVVALCVGCGGGGDSGAEPETGLDNDGGADTGGDTFVPEGDGDAWECTQAADCRGDPGPYYQWRCSEEHRCESAPIEVELAAAGVARHEVVVADDASEAVVATATELAEYLGRMSGASFTVATGDGTRGVAVGTTADFPALGLAGTLSESDHMRRQTYVLRSHPDGVHVVGAADSGVMNAVWDLLYRIGHRQFFPGDAWEIVPSVPELRVAVNTQPTPSFLGRNYGIGYGETQTPWTKDRMRKWRARNRMTSFVGDTGHAVGRILVDRENRPIFEAHPEYLALVGGKRVDINAWDAKLCIGNPEVRKLVAAWAVRRFQADPGLGSLSVSPSDGEGYCECDLCQALGSPSDQTVVLANEAAQAVQAALPDKRYVGLQAYAVNIDPPNIDVHSHVLIGICDFRRGYRRDEVAQGWMQKAPDSVFSGNFGYWTRWVPGTVDATKGNVTASDFLGMPAILQHRHAEGDDLFSAEIGHDWGASGLGMYLNSRVLFAIDEANRIGELIDDFLDKSFGPSARAPMKQYYELMDAARFPVHSTDLIGRMYRRLDEARTLETQGPIRTRLDELVKYTRFVELEHTWAFADDAHRAAATEALLRHTYRMRESVLVHTVGVFQAIPDSGWDLDEASNPWKDTTPFTAEELDRFVRDGVASNPLIDFEPVEFGTDLVPAAPLGLSTPDTGFPGYFGSDVQELYTWFEVPGSLTLSITGGQVKPKGSALVTLHAASQGNAEVYRATVPADGVQRDVVLSTPYTGLHKVRVEDGSSGTAVVWPVGTPMTWLSSLTNPTPDRALHPSWSLYFYVPKGTQWVAGWNSGAGDLRDSSGNVIYTFTAPASYFKVAVPAGQDGGLWKCNRCTGERRWMTVPPQMARSASELLLPAEVVSP